MDVLARVKSCDCKFVLDVTAFGIVTSRVREEKKLPRIRTVFASL